MNTLIRTQKIYPRLKQASDEIWLLYQSLEKYSDKQLEDSVDTIILNLKHSISSIQDSPEQD